MRYKTPAALEMAVKEAAKKSPLDTNRAIAGFYFHRLLCRVFSDPDSPFVLKGGQSVLARTVDARATRDIDLLARETSVEAAVADLRRLAGIGLDDFIRFSFDKAEPIKADDECRSGMKVWFTPSLGGKSLQAVSVDLVVDEVDGLEPETITPADRLQIDDVAPGMVSAEELALGTHWEHGASTWSPSLLIWAAAEGNDTLEPNDNISHSTKTQGR